MLKKEFTVVSNYDNLELKGIIFEPQGEAKGIVQFVHGMCERSSRYEEYMEFFAKNGYVAVCYDQRGHGDSVEKDEDRGFFGDPYGKSFVDDCVQVTKYLKEQYPNLPLTLYGHSMGSLIARCYIQEHDTLIDKLIVSASPSVDRRAGIAILWVRLLDLFLGERHRSKMFTYISMRCGSKKFKKIKKGSWLSRDSKVAEKFFTDPKCAFLFTYNGFENLFYLMKDTYNKKRYKVANPDLPIHFISGSEDPLMVSDKEWLSAIGCMTKVGYKTVTKKLYQDMRHEIHNEFGKEEVYQDALAFIEG